MDPRKPIFDFLSPHLKDSWNTPGLIGGFNAQLDALGARRAEEAVAGPTPGAPPVAAINPADPLTSRVAVELVGHESIVLEDYKDSEGIWTWGIGVTNRSGHSIDGYKDHPQSVEHVIAVYIWLLRHRYIPDVLSEFAGRALTEAQFAAALSFHYNTGAIRQTSWVDLWLAGRTTDARKFLESHYLNGGALTSRRAAEAALFFDGKWSQDGKATIWPVLKPSYTPDWHHPQRVDITAAVAAALAAA